MIIYLTTNLINGKIYIGKDSKNNPNYMGSGKIIELAIKKYGKSNFHKQILEYCSNIIELNEREIYWINKYNSVDNKIGYNILIGGGGCNGFKHKESFILKMKSIKRNKKWRESISNSLTGSKHKPERIEKNRLSQIGLQSGSNNPMAKKYRIISPLGIEHIIFGELNKFCQENKLHHRLMIRVSKGLQNNHKGWKIEEIIEI